MNHRRVASVDGVRHKPVPCTKMLEAPQALVGKALTGIGFRFREGFGVDQAPFRGNHRGHQAAVRFIGCRQHRLSRPAVDHRLVPDIHGAVAAGGAVADVIVEPKGGFRLVGAGNRNGKEHVLEIIRRQIRRIVHMSDRAGDIPAVSGNRAHIVAARHAPDCAVGVHIADQAARVLSLHHLDRGSGGAVLYDKLLRRADQAARLARSCRNGHILRHKAAPDQPARVADHADQAAGTRSAADRRVADGACVAAVHRAAVGIADQAAGAHGSPHIAVGGVRNRAVDHVAVCEAACADSAADKAADGVVALHDAAPHGAVSCDRGAVIMAVQAAGIRGSRVAFRSRGLHRAFDHVDVGIATAVLVTAEAAGICIPVNVPPLDLDVLHHVVVVANHAARVGACAGNREGVLLVRSGYLHAGVAAVAADLTQMLPKQATHHASGGDIEIFIFAEAVIGIDVVVGPVHIAGESAHIGLSLQRDRHIFSADVGE